MSWGSEPIWCWEGYLGTGRSWNCGLAPMVIILSCQFQPSSRVALLLWNDAGLVYLLTVKYLRCNRCSKIGGLFARDVILELGRLFRLPLWLGHA